MGLTEKKEERITTPTSVTSRGFSLLEISLTLVIIGIVLGFTLPNFQALFDSRLMQETKKAAKLIRQVRNQAILSGINYQLVVDAKKSEITVQAESKELPGVYEADSSFSAVRFKMPIEIHSLRVGKEEEVASLFKPKKLRFKKLFGTIYQFRIDSNGFTDMFTLLITNQERLTSLAVTNIMGNIQIADVTPD